MFQNSRHATIFLAGALGKVWKNPGSRANGWLDLFSLSHHGERVVPASDGFHRICFG